MSKHQSVINDRRPEVPENRKVEPPSTKAITPGNQRTLIQMTLTSVLILFNIFYAFCLDTD